MPGKKVTDPQVQKYKQHCNMHTQIAAAKSRARMF